MTASPNLLAQLLESGRTILADGATGTHIEALLEQQGLAPPRAEELLNIDQPDLVRQHYRAYIDAGSDVILTNSWEANRFALADADLTVSPQEIRELNAAAARLLSEEVASAGRPIVRAGSVGPTDWIVTAADDHDDLHDHEIRYADAVSAFTDQILGLLDGGIDVVWIETQISQHEVEAAVTACRQAGQAVGREIPFVISMVFNRHEQTQASYDLHHFADEFGQGENRPTAMGINCGFGPDAALELVAQNQRIWLRMPPLLVKANCGAPRHVGGGRYVPSGLTPRQMARYAQLAADYGVRIVGGCCGSLPSHIAAMRDALDGYKPAPPQPASNIHAIIERAH